MKKIAIFPKDAEKVTGWGPSKCRKLIRDIKKVVSKEKHQLVTISEFCNYMGFTEEEVINSLK